MKQAIIATLVLFILVVVGFVGYFVFSRNRGTSAPSEKRVDGGVQFSSDGGGTWQPRVTVNDTYSIAGVDVLTLVQHPNNEEIVYLGTEGNGLYRSVNKGRNWEAVTASPILPGGGDVRRIVFDPHNAETFYMTAFVDTHGSLIKSTDGGKTFFEVYQMPQENLPIYSVALDPTRAGTVYIGTGDGGILLSTDSGSTWKIIAHLSSPILDLDINPRTPGELFATVHRHGIFRSTNNGTEWRDLRESLRSFPRAEEGRVLALDHSNPRHLVYASAYGLLESFTGGDTWQEIPFIAPPRSLTVVGLVQSPVNSREWYASADSLLYKSTDSGEHWSVTGLRTQKRVSAILVNAARTHEMLVGLHE
ncbi:MAG: hypothetical protein HY460_03115 [Parcubacteria group bacterium]|nr:hypothetical protein [Parcubacteria group bacterium]